ncbi:MAG TPA: hypothetical protein H9690_01525 [Firmicutes bacterium]|nr:hypothetical protein [Bacillota bacterium]
MKNQTNKKVSKLLMSLLALVIMSVACVAFAACNQECKHPSFTDGADTATCTSGGFITHTCDDCGYVYLTPTQKKAHSFGAATQVPATCTTEGYTLKVCTECGYQEKTDIVDPTGHVNTETITNEATCSASGSEIVRCKDCGAIVSINTIPALEHDYQTTQVIEATCTETGMKIEVCKACGKEHMEIIDKVDHVFTTTNVAATCLERAHKVDTCDNCGYTVSYDFTGELAPHAYETISESNATCVSAGVLIEECTVCGDRHQEVTPATGVHTYGDSPTETVAATCTTDGYTAYTCIYCGYVHKVNVVEATGHTMVKLSEVAATCTTTGEVLEECSVCGEQKITVLPKLSETGEHTFGEEVVVKQANCYETGLVTKTCEICGYVEETVLGLTPHSYTIADAAAAGDEALNALLAQIEVEKPELYAKYQANGGKDYYYSVAAVTCTEMGNIIKKCDYCEQRYQDGSQAALGHVFLVAPVVHEATCYNEGYTVYECERCGYEAGERTAIQPQLAHQMTLEAGEETLTLYAKANEEGALTIYTDADCLNQLPATELCNVFYMNDANEKFVFRCDACADALGKEYVLAESRTATEYRYTADGQNLVVYSVTKSVVEETLIASTEHVYATEADVTLSDALVCEKERKEIYPCTSCTETYHKYNVTALVEDAENGNKLINPNGHYEDVAYVWYYHQLPGIPTKDGYSGTTPAGAGEVAYEKINTTTGLACVQEATYNYGCKLCGQSLNYQVENPYAVEPSTSTTGVVAENGAKIDINTINGTQIEAVYEAYLATLTEEEAAAEKAKGYVILTEEMMTSAPLGHNFDVNDGATHVVKAYDAEAGTFADRTCNPDEVLVIAIKCSRCDELNYTAAEGTYEGSYDINAAKKYSNVAHGQINEKELAKGNFAWLNVVYYAYNEKGEWVNDANAETPGAIATVLNPNAEGNKCDEFNCALCEETVAQHHYGDRTPEAVNCYNAQDCVYCGIELIAESHVYPKYTCRSVKGDEYFYCAICGDDPDSPALGRLTPHSDITITLLEENAPTCTETGTYTITCGCRYTATWNGQQIMASVFTGAQEGTAAYDLYQANKGAIDSAIDGGSSLTFNVSWLTIKELGHTEVAPAEGAVEGETYSVVASHSEPTCTTKGETKYNCGRCGIAMDGKDGTENQTVEVPALGHTHVEPAEGAVEGEIYSVIASQVAATCTTKGVTEYKCGRPDCGVAMDGTNGTENQTVEVPALGHDLTIKVNPNVHNCIYGASVEITCAHENCPTVTKTNLDNALIRGVLYQAKVVEMLTNESKFISNWNELIAAGGSLYFVPKEHTYTKFDTKTSHEGDEEVHSFVKPTATTKGSAFWTCAECNDRSYIANSVSLSDYYDPDKNMDYATTAALETANITVNGVAVDALPKINVVEYFTVADNGYTMKAEKAADLANAIYNAVAANGEIATLNVNGTVVAWSTEGEGATTKGAIATALQTQLTELTVVITYTTVQA